MRARANTKRTNQWRVHLVKSPSPSLHACTCADRNIFRHGAHNDNYTYNLSQQHQVCSQLFSWFQSLSLGEIAFSPHPGQDAATSEASLCPAIAWVLNLAPKYVPPSNFQEVDFAGLEAGLAKLTNYVFFNRCPRTDIGTNQ